MKKRGEVEIQFAWLFTAILGGMILLFFIVIALRLSDASDIQISNELGQKLDTTLKSIGSSAGGGANMSYERDKKVIVECELIDGAISSRFFIEGARDEHPLSTRIVFSPKDVQDNILYSFTKEFVPGTKSATFNYFSSKNVIYVLIKDPANDGKAEALSNMMFLKLINKKIINPTDTLNLKEQSPHHVNLITFDLAFFESCNSSLVGFENNCEGKLGIQSLPNSLLTVIYIEADNAKFNAGRVKIATANDVKVTTVESGFYSKEMALGAVFSGDGESYACNVKKTIEAWLMHTDLIKRRKELLSEEPSLDGDCLLIFEAITNDNNNGKLDQAVDILRTYNPLSDNYEFTALYDLLQNPAQNSVNELNKQLRLGTGRCPLVY